MNDPKIYAPWPDFASKPEGWPDTYVDAAEYFAIAAQLAAVIEFLEAHWTDCTQGSSEMFDRIRSGGEIGVHDPECPLCRFNNRHGELNGYRDQS